MISEPEFDNLSAQGFNRIPVVAQAFADLETPLSLYLKLANSAPFSFLLESVVGGERFGRYSFIGLPARTLRLIMAGHDELFAALHDFAARDRKQLTFIVGNHDAAMLFPKVQDLLRERIGHSLQIKTEYSIDGVLIMHGHQYEFIHNLY